MKPPASGSSAMSAKATTPSGTPVQVSGGETSSASHVYLVGIAVPSSNAGLPSTNELEVAPGVKVSVSVAQLPRATPSASRRASFAIGPC